MRQVFFCSLTRKVCVARLNGSSEIVMFGHQLRTVTVHHNHLVVVAHQPRLNVHHDVKKRLIASCGSNADMKISVPFTNRVVTVPLPHVVLITCPAFHLLNLTWSSPFGT